MTGGDDAPKFSSSRIFPLLILLLGLVVYSNTIGAPFSFDDYYYVVKNPAVKNFRYFSEPALMEQGISKGVLNQNFRSRRVAEFSFAVNYWLAGPRVEVYHAFNIILHLANAFLVYWLVHLTLRTPLFANGGGLPPGQIKNAALLVALFFVAHPVQTGAVTYICQRFTSMATMFYLLALNLFIVWRMDFEGAGVGDEPADGGRLWRPMVYGLSLLSTLLAMFTKEIAFTLPLMMVLYDGMFLGWSLKMRPWPFLPFLASLLLIPSTILSGGAKYEDVTRLTTSFTETWAGNPAFTYLLTQFRVIVTYLRLLILPLHQNLDYDYPRYTDFFQGPVLGSFIFLCLLLGLAIYLYRCSARQPGAGGGWQRLISFGICWFFLALAVESTIVPLKDLIFEHRLYLPSVGFFLAILGGVGFARARFVRARGAWVSILLVVLLIAMSVAAYTRNSLWADPVALWEDTVRKSPDKFRPHSNLAREYAAYGRLPEAEREYLRALQIDERRPLDHLVLGTIYLGTGRIEKAFESLERAARLDPSNPDIYYFLGLVLTEKGDTKAADLAFQKSQKLDPANFEAKRKMESVLKGVSGAGLDRGPGDSRKNIK